MGAIGYEQIPVHHTLNKAASENQVQDTPDINTEDSNVLKNDNDDSNDKINVDMEYATTSAIVIKRSVNDDSSDEETRPNTKKMSAFSSPVSKLTGTCVYKLSDFPPS